MALFIDKNTARGFTLIEMSIVLVIIGLIVGGVLVGQSLIQAAAVRAQISQIEKYNTAANTFRGKYDYLPGDIKDPEATQFGFTPRGTNRGEGDGNGVLQASCNTLGACGAPGLWPSLGLIVSYGETAMFWVDLSTAQMIENGGFVGTPATAPGSTVTATTTPSVSNFLPAAKIGGTSSVYAWSSGNNNYFGISVVYAIFGIGPPSTGKGMTVAQAASIDGKTDDGFPLTGNVTAQGIGGWAGNMAGVATPGTATTCYDNGNSASATQSYSLAQGGGAGVNCTQSFRFQ